MKRIVGLLTFIVLLSVSAYGQEPSSVYADAMMSLPLAYDLTEREVKPAYKDSLYWKRYKAQRALGWTSLGLGISTVGIGFFGGYIDDLPSRWSDVKPGWKTLFYSGICLTAVSIPLFVFSHRNKREVRSFSMGADCITTPAITGGSRNSQPALAFRFCF